MRTRFLDVPRGTGALLFDLDGTLADTDPAHFRAWRHTAENLLGTTFTWDDYRQACLVRSLTPVEFLWSLGVDARAAAVADAKDAAYRRLIRAELVLAAGVPELLDAVERAGIPVAVVSGASRRSVDTFVSTLWPVRAPVVTVSRDDTEEQKPHPEPYRLAIARLGRRATQCVAVEGSARGTLSAGRAGLRTLRIGSESANREPPADLTVADLATLEARVTSFGVTLSARELTVEATVADALRDGGE